MRHHHERYDAAGYPDGLAGDEIPLASRIIAICDAFDAMTCDRPYRRARTHDDPRLADCHPFMVEGDQWPWALLSSRIGRRE